MFKEVYVLEKIHGTSAHIRWDSVQGLSLFSGGENHKRFSELFAVVGLTSLSEKFEAFGRDKVVIYGEAYGGKQQGMSATYGKELKFIVFDVKIDGCWLSVPQMDSVAKHFGLEVVSWAKVPARVAMLDYYRDMPSIQAWRNGMGGDKLREGIVIRPLMELTKNNGDRIIAKHKGDAFSETKTPRKVVSKEKLKVMEEAAGISEEWCTEMRLSHVLDRLGNPGIERTKDVILAMIEDILREAAGEIVESKAAKKAIGSRTAQMFKNRLKANLQGE